MTLKEYIEHYEKELDKLEKHKVELLEVDRNTRYTDNKIDFIYNLLVILKTCTKTEKLKEKCNEYEHLTLIIEYHFEEIEKYKIKNDEESVKKEIEKLLKRLRKETLDDVED